MLVGVLCWWWCCVVVKPRLVVVLGFYSFAWVSCSCPEIHECGGCNACKGDEREKEERRRNK